MDVSFFTPNTMKGALNLLGGPAFPTQFITMIMPPAGLLGSGGFKALLANPISAGTISTLASTAATINLSLMTEKAVIPGRSFETVPLLMHGQHRRMPIHVIHDTAKFRFICTNSMIERTFFDLWTQHIQRPSSLYMEYFDNYKTTIYIKKVCDSGLINQVFAPSGDGMSANNPLVEAGNLLSTYYLEEAYPLSISAQELSTSSTGEFLTLDVEFAYTHSRCVLDDIVPEIFGGPDTPLAAPE